MEKVCDKANEYALIVNPLTGKAVYVNRFVEVSYGMLFIESIRYFTRRVFVENQNNCFHLGSGKIQASKFLSGKSPIIQKSSP